MIDIQKLLKDLPNAESHKAAAIDTMAKLAIAEHLERIANVLEAAQAPQFDDAFKTVGYND